MIADFCPHCGVSLVGDEIPDQYRHHNVPGEPYYNPNEPTHDEQVARYGHCFCLPWGEAIRWSRKIGLEDPVADRVVEWLCPDCGGRWPR